MADDRFDLWLEFELWLPEEGGDPEDDIFNMQIFMRGGKTYALTVWTYKAIWRAVKECRESGECIEGSYLLPPDLFVHRLDRTLLEQIVADLVVAHEAERDAVVDFARRHIDALGHLQVGGDEGEGVLVEAERHAVVG